MAEESKTKLLREGDQPRKALGLPDGSVRALLALAIFGLIWAMLILRPDDELPDYLRDLLFIIMGHYFASRRRASRAGELGPPPLYLPRGTIRLALFGGFVLVAVVLFRQGKLTNPGKHPGVLTLLLVAGFLLGVVLAKLGDWWTDRGHRVPRWVEDGKALVALIAAAGLIVLAWDLAFPFLPRGVEGRFGGALPRLGSYGPEHVLSAIVGFYFGSRS